MVYNENIKNTARKSDPGQGLQIESYNRAEDCWEMTKFMVGGGTIDLDLFLAPDPYLLEKLKNAATFRNESLTFPDSFNLKLETRTGKLSVSQFGSES
jgi:hypothetical protein